MVRKSNRQKAPNLESLRNLSLANPQATALIAGVDEKGAAVSMTAIREVPLTLFVNDREVVTMMTIGDLPRELAVGYLLNQSLIRTPHEIVGIDVDEEIHTVVVRTKTPTPFEKRRAALTSGCAQGTQFLDMMEDLTAKRLPASPPYRASSLITLGKAILAAPSLYQQAGAIHGCVLAHGARALIYIEDIGRHNAVDKIAGYMALNAISALDKVFYTTGRLTSEMVIKTVQMGLPILISRSGYTAWAVSLARQANLTLIARLRGKRFYVLSGRERVIFDEPERPDLPDPISEQKNAQHPKNTSAEKGTHHGKRG
ncbi:MAG: formate dehydrogenase accessory sulfurtransferase FdhD [Pseudomonadota bacterium]